VKRSRDFTYLENFLPKFRKEIITIRRARLGENHGNFTLLGVDQWSEHWRSPKLVPAMKRKESKRNAVKTLRRMLPWIGRLKS
jgi:hypothetical protein